MRKLDEDVVGKRITLTKEALDMLQDEANRKTNGNISGLLRIIFKKRYKL